MSANLNGNVQSYQPFALRIFEGLKPDIVAIQEFNYLNNTPADFRSMLDTAFGTNFVYFRETGYTIPNGIISRFPLRAAGSWDDPLVSDRGFAWAQVALPGTNDLYVVSLHLYSSGTTTDRDTEATLVKSLISSNFPPEAWVIVAGDFNTSTRTEPAIDTFTTFLSDSPIPTDAQSGGNPNTNEPRNKPYDYVLPSFSFTNALTNVVFPSHVYSNGLVFDSRVYTNDLGLADFSPIQLGDSSNAQHMAILKDFVVSVVDLNLTDGPPAIVSQPQSQLIHQGGDATFTVTAVGAPTLTYQWRLNGADISGATASSYTRTNVQPVADEGDFSVTVTNDLGSLLSSNATLTVSTAPLITAQPQSQTAPVDATVTFSVTALSSSTTLYQWRFNSNNISWATNASCTLTNVQLTNAGAYSVVVSNDGGSVISSNAMLTVTAPAGPLIAQWNFNSPTPDANTTSGTTVPSVGVGSALLVDGTSQTFASGSSTDPAAAGSDNSAWNTSSYPAQGTGNKTAGVRFDVSTAGHRNIQIRWDQRESGTGSKYVRLQYSTNGVYFFDFPVPTSVVSTSFEPKTNALAGILGVDDNPNFAFRIVSEFESTAVGTSNPNYVGATSSYGTAGTIRFDMVSVSGDVISAAPVQPAFLSDIIFNNAGRLQFTLTGSPGSNYMIQAATDLSASNWVSLGAEPAPFIFMDTNSTSLGQRFYRALAVP